MSIELSHSSLEGYSVAKIMKSIRKDLYSATPEDIHTPSIYYLQTNLEGEPALLAFLVIKTRGCTWQFKAGGCTMCGYSIESGRGQKVDSKDIMVQVDKGIKSIKENKPAIVALAPTGSFFDDREINHDLRKWMFKRVTELGFVKVLMTESRAEHVLNAEVSIRELLKILGDTEFTVALGLESSNDFIRNFCVNKGLLIDDYLKAVKILRDNKIHVLTHILVKPPFLSEGEAIEDAVNSIRFAFNNGSEIVTAMFTSIQPYTLTHWLWSRGEYRVPWLWSAIEILRKLSPLNEKDLAISGLRITPIPIEVAHNCPKCDELVLSALRDWELHRDSAIIEKVDNISCTCKEQWRVDLIKPSKSLPERVSHFYGLINKQNNFI